MSDLESPLNKAGAVIASFEGVQDVEKFLAAFKEFEAIIAEWDEANLRKLFLHLHKDYPTYMANELARFAIRRVLVEKHHYTHDQISKLEAEGEARL